MNNSIKRNRSSFEQFVDIVDWARTAAANYPNGLSLTSISDKIRADLGLSVAENTLRSACAKSGLAIVSARSKGHASDDTRFLAALVADVSRGVRDGWSISEQMRLTQIRAGKKAG